MTRATLLWLLVATMAAIGCGDDEVRPDTPDADTAADAGARTDAATVALDWQPCPFYTGGTGLDAACASVQVPFDWADPGGDTVELFVKRLGDPSVPGQQLWFLMGGPGGASNGYEGMAETVLGADSSFDVYLLDHRGTGRSSRLGCPVQEADASDAGWAITLAEWPACIASLQQQWGDDLAHFTTTQAARDLGWLIERTRAPGQLVHVHGGSYGTFWAQRYLQLFPDQPTSVSMLGVVHPQFSFTHYNQTYEDAGAAYLAKCGADTLCASKLGVDPELTFRAVMDDVPGACPAAASAGLTRDVLRPFFGGQLIWGWDERLVPLALIYRIQRCDPADVTALQYFATHATNPIDGLLNDRLFSTALGNHIGLSDLWEAPVPSLADEQALVADALWAFGSTTRLQLAPMWPTYPEDEYADVFADTTVPILSINGELDPASPLAQALPVGEHFDGPHQHFVAIPGGSHSWTSPTSDGYGCSINMWFNFMLDPTAPLLDCVDEILPLDFSGNATLASSMFGTTSLWENTTTAAPPPLPDPALVRRVRANYWRARTGQVW